MHPKFILTILTICFSKITFSQEIEIPIHLDDYNLVGKVKSISENSYIVDEKTGRKNSLRTGGDPYFYNRVWIGFNYKFNSHGFIVEKEFVASKTSNMSLNYYYEDGNILSHSTYGNGLFVRNTNYKYYPSGLLKEVYSSENSNNKVKSTSTKYNYTKDGLILEIQKEKNYKLIYRHKYNYKDSLNYYLQTYYFSAYNGSEELTEKTIRQLNSKNKITYQKEISCYSNEESDDFKEVRIKYNRNGDIIEYIKYDSDDGISRKRLYKYTYDTHNNWIERITYINGYPKFIAKREYRYY